MSYRVLAPVGFIHDGQGVSCTTVGAVVEVDDDQAKALVKAGKLEAVKGALTETEMEADKNAAEARARMKAVKASSKPES